MRYIDLVAFRCREHPEREFATDGTRSVSYAEADRIANRIANALIGSGCGAGVRVSILAANSVEYALFYLGAAKAGAVATPLNYRLAIGDWTYILDHAEVRLCVVAAEYHAAVEGLRDGVPSLETVLVLGDDYERWRDAAPDTPAAPGPVPSSPLYQVYTSGTTGLPKGVVLSQEAMAWHVVQQAEGLGGTPIVSGRLLVTAPMFHAGITALWMTAAAWGGTLYVQERFDPPAAVAALDEQRITWTLLIPAMVQACLVQAPGVAERAFADLELMVYGGSPISESTLRRAMDVFGCEFLQLYGLTETNTVVMLAPRDHARALAGRADLLLAAGRPVPGSAIRICDEQGRELAPGEVGEIHARGPQLMTEYFKQPEATAEALVDGWMRTGDAGRLDEEGYLYVQDRIKDMIVTGGENVYPRAVENVLFGHPAVADVAVIGVPDDRWGETVKAIVVLRDGHDASEQELLEFCRGRVAGFMRPRSVDFATELPRNPSGKVLKTELREPYWHGHSRRVA